MPRLVLSPKVLDHLDFGTPSAERDIGRGLEKYFVESSAYQRVRSGTKTIVLGNRGAGKSAIFQMLAKRERVEGNTVIELSPDEYSYELLSAALVSENAGSWAKHGAYAAAWKYLIYVLVMKELARKGLRTSKGAGSAIYKYVRDNHDGVQLGKLSLLVSYLKRLEGIKIGSLEAGFRTRELDRLYKLEEITALLPALSQVLDTRKVLVIVDELDRGWDSSEDAKAFVSGLFQACVTINGLHRNLRVYISLRQELYDDIPALYEDAQKHRDLVETIHWTEESLLELIAKRIRHSAQDRGYDGEMLKKVSDIGCWSAVFSGTAGRQAFQYVMDRTLYRPREVIQFCTEALENARGRVSHLPLPNVALTKAERGYSEERAKDIAAEYRYQYPGPMNVFDVFRGRCPTFDRDELLMLVLELATGGIPTRDTGSWLPEREPEDLVEILWQVGFLTAQPIGDTAFVGAHQAQHLNLDAVQHFEVHPLFRAYLGMQEPARV